MKWTPQEKYNNSYNEYGRRCKVCALFFMPQINVKMLNQDTLRSLLWSFQFSVEGGYILLT